MKNSIFNLSNKMGVESPFDNWLEKQELDRKQDRLDRKRGYEEDYQLGKADDFSEDTPDEDFGYLTAADFLEKGIKKELKELPSDPQPDKKGYNFSIMTLKTKNYDRFIKACRTDHGASCMTICNLAYTHGNATVRDYILKEINAYINKKKKHYKEHEKPGKSASRQFAFNFFEYWSQAGPASHIGFISPVNAINAQRGDIFFDGFEDSADEGLSQEKCPNSWGGNCGHTGILTKSPTLSKDGQTLRIDFYAAYNKNNVFDKYHFIFKKTSHESSIWVREKKTGTYRGKRYLLGFGRVDEMKIRGTQNYKVPQGKGLLYVQGDTGLSESTLKLLNPQLNDRGLQANEKLTILK